MKIRTFIHLESPFDERDPSSTSTPTPPEPVGEVCHTHTGMRWEDLHDESTEVMFDLSQPDDNEPDT